MNFKQISCMMAMAGMLFSINAAEKTKYLESLKVSAIKSGWKSTQKGKSVAGNPLTIAGKVYSRGIGTHAESHVAITLSKTANRFKAVVGVDDASGGLVVFKVKLDGKVAWKSGLMRKGDKAKKIDLNLSGANIMELIVEDGGNGIGSDHANWCDAKIDYSGKAPFIQLFSEWKNIITPAELKTAKAALIPYPVKVAWKKGTFRTQSLNISVKSSKKDSKSAIVAIKRFAKSCDVLVSVSSKGNVKLSIGRVTESKHPEAYNLTVDPRGIAITANTSAGLFYGVQTLRQLVTEKSGKLSIPFCSIVDYPAFGIRGFMHDVGRNFITIDELKKQIDMMALYKMNVFHFHPTENEGYRVESKKYPKLNEAKFMTRYHGKFYTVAELKDLVEYCKERHVTILPELDMPGHSAYFNKVFGFGMQSDDGVRVLKELVDEWLEIFDAPWFHLGTDEVRLTRPTFVAEMTKYLRDKGKKTISWHHGLHPYDGKTIHQCWNAGRKDNPIIDSVGYVNTDDAIMQVRNYFFRQYCQVTKEDERNLGGILCYWPDEPVVNEDVEMQIAPVYPAILAFCERIWQGNPNSWPVKAKEISWHGAPEMDGGRHKAFVEFEQRLIKHRERFFKPFRPEHFPYVQNAQVKWNVIGPFANNGDANTVFGPEKEIKSAYDVNGEKFEWQTNWGGTVSIEEALGQQCEKEATHTAYALTYVYSPKEMEIGAWINFSRKYLAWPQGRNPQQGDWACEGSRVWINDKIVEPPKWEKPGRYRAPVTEESYIYRKPLPIKLKKGWNKVMVKSTNLFSPWTVSFLPVEKDGKGFKEVKGLKYSNKLKQCI